MHKCPIDKCATNLSDALLMCADHWRCVPRPMQREVYAAYNRGKPPDREQLLRVQMKAIEYVNNALAGKQI